MQTTSLSSSSSSSSSSLSFFSSLLSPSLLSLSPLQSIIDYLHDSGRIQFCRVNKEHQTILSRMRMSDYHILTSANWSLIEQRGGPLITSVELKELTELSQIPVHQRGLIKRVKFAFISSKKMKCGPISRSLIPPLLEELVTAARGTHKASCHNHNSQNYPIKGDELPILPSTLKTLIIGFHMEDIGTNAQTEMFKRALSEVTNLTHLGMTMWEYLNDDDDDDDDDEDDEEEEDINKEDKKINILSILPQTIETLDLHMCTRKMPKSATEWPKAMKHLILESDCDYLEADSLDLIPLPKSLVSITFPFIYDHYGETLKHARAIESLREMKFGRISKFDSEPESDDDDDDVIDSNGGGGSDGTSTFSVSVTDFFSLLPRTLTHLPLLNADWDEVRPQKIDSLPDTIEVLRCELNNEPFTRWPSSLRILHIDGNQFSQDLDSLPDSIEELILPANYRGVLTKWPKYLKKLNVRPEFFSIASLEKLPPSLIDLSVSLPLVRRMMSSGSIMKILPRLIRLSLFGRPDLSLPFDLRLLPRTVVELRFYLEIAQLLGREDRSNICATIFQLKQRDVDNDYDDDDDYLNSDSEVTVMDEIDLEATIVIMNDLEMTLLRRDDNDQHTSILTSNQMQTNSNPIVVSAVTDGATIGSAVSTTTTTIATVAASSDVMKVPPDQPTTYSTNIKQLKGRSHKENMNAPASKKFIESMKTATRELPISGVSLNSIYTHELLQALTVALTCDAIIGPLALIECGHWQPSSYYQPARQGDLLEATKQKEQTNQVLIKLLEAMPNSKITRLKIENPPDLFHLQKKNITNSTAAAAGSVGSIDSVGSSSSSLSLSSSSSSSATIPIPEGFLTFCTSISRMPTLRTIELRSCRTINPDMIQLLIHTLLTSKCAAQIESLDLSGCTGCMMIGVKKKNTSSDSVAQLAVIISICQLLRESRTMKHLSLASCELTIGSIWKLCQSLVVNRSLQTINLAGNKGGVAGSHAIRWTARQNCALSIQIL